MGFSMFFEIDRCVVLPLPERAGVATPKGWDQSPNRLPLRE